MNWREVETGIWISDDGKRVLVDDCDCGQEGCPGPADIDGTIREALAQNGYSLSLRYWDAVNDGQPHGQAISREQ